MTNPNAAPIPDRSAPSVTQRSRRLDNDRLSMTLAALGGAAAIALHALSASSLLVGAAFLLAASFGLLHARAKRQDKARRRSPGPASEPATSDSLQVRGQSGSTAPVSQTAEYQQQAKALELANAQLEARIAELEERTRVITLLGRMSDRLQTAVTSADAHALIADFARKLFPLGGGALCTLDPTSYLAEVAVSWGEPAARRAHIPAECRVLRSARSLEVDDDCDVVGCHHNSFDLPAARTCLPITEHGRTVAVLCFHWPPGSYDAADDAAASGSFRIKLAAAFAEQVALALANLRLKLTLRTQAVRDPLTGLHNRRFLDEGFQRDLQRAVRTGGPVGVLMLDLDNFKAFNDAHGHAAGDALLCAFAAQLRRHVRAADIACRYGGEEFVVILPDATLEQSISRAEQIREETRDLHVDFRGSVLPGPTVSVGIAAWPQNGTSSDALLRAADAALYLAKANGRDRTETAAQLCGSLPANRD